MAGDTLVITKAKAIAGDIEWGMGTVEQERLGILGTYEQVNASHIPYSSTLSIAEKILALESGESLSLKYAYESEAQKRTARSYAIEPENVEVKQYTSNGDGSFTITSLTGVYSALHYEASASASETEAQLSVWIAEAWQLTAESYANEPVDTFVNVVTSDGDGTFTYTPSTDYSALHYKAKAEAFDPRDLYLAMTANDINLTSHSVFSKTITGATTLTVSGIPASGTVATFILELTNPSTNITWFSGVTWAYGVEPTLTTTGTDILSFYTRDGGTTWRGSLMSKDSQ